MTVREMTIPGYKGEFGDLLYDSMGGMTYTPHDWSEDSKEYWISLYYQYRYSAKTSVTGSPTIGRSKLTSVVGRGKENPCFHDKFRGVNVPFLYLTTQYNNPSRYFFTYHFRYGILNYPDTEKVKDPVDYRAAKSRAYWTMAPRFEGDISMLNFLYELKDFRDIAVALPKMFRGLSKLQLNVGNYLRRNSKLRSEMKFSGLVKNDVVDTRYFKDVLRRNSRDVKRLLQGVKDSQPSLLAAEAWLIYAFAIQPLVKDIAAMLSQATLLAEDAQRQFKDAGVDVQTSHYTEKFLHHQSGSPGTYNDYWWTKGEFRQTVYTATCKYTYDYTMRSHFDAFMRYWGLSGNFEALWNATPWSFLVDYVVQVGKSIHAMERDPNVQWNIKSWVDTLKWTYSRGMYINGDPRSKCFVVDGKFLSPNKATGKLLTGVEGSIYDRKVSQPIAGLYVPKLKGPSLKQWLNVAALARCFF